MKVADIMTTNIVTIDSGATIAQAAKMMQRYNVRVLIVDRASEEDAYGIITQTDIAKAIALAKNLEQTFVSEVMTKPCIVVNPDLATEQIARLFTRANIRTAPVIKDRLLGIVSLTDILTKTNCLSSIEVELNSKTKEKLADIALDESREKELIIEWEREYDNWCSG
ncbi:MAG TPA: CBS domain-containing protein [Xenococcaceae cyanobacterium]